MRYLAASRLAVLTLVALLGVLVLAVVGREVPDVLVQVLLLLVGATAGTTIPRGTRT